MRLEVGFQQKLGNKTVEEGPYMTCIFDMANLELMDERARMRENFGFLHISTMHSGYKSVGWVDTLILEKTEKEEEWKRIGIAFMKVDEAEGAKRGWEKWTVRIV